MKKHSKDACRRLRVLFVCAMNKQRSVTAAYLFRRDPRLEVRSAGVRAEARRRINRSDLSWADIVYVMEQDQKQRIADEFRDMPLPAIDVLEIPDDYEFMDPLLIEILNELMPPELDVRLAEISHGAR